ncbi:MAG: hypothetical protein ACKO9Q_17880, partial [Pirellula sp.]
MRTRRNQNLVHLLKFAFGLGIIASDGFVNNQADAQSKPNPWEPRSQAHRVLSAEAQGQPVDRAGALQSVATGKPKRLAYESINSKKSENDHHDWIRWQIGQVGLAQGWLSLDQLNFDSMDHDVKSYYNRRPEIDFDAQAHRTMARWCVTQGLT